VRIDLLHLLRSLRRSRASAGAAVVTLALTLGAGASIFALVDAVLLTPPPFSDPDALVLVGEVPPDAPMAAPRAVTQATFEAWRERAGWLAALEGFDGTNLTLTGLGVAERISATDVTPGFLTLLGVSPILGRTFVPGDVGQRIAVISHGFWRGRLASDSAVIGRELVLGAEAHTIVGVLPATFFFALDSSDIWRPQPITPAQAARDGRQRVIARLAGNASAAHLADALEGVSRASSPPARVVVTSVSRAIAGESTRTLGILAAAAGLAVLIAFANLAGLLIVRTIDRRRELAVRSALGARRSQIAKQMLLEAAALVVAGTVGGVLLAFWTASAAGNLAVEHFGRVANREVTVSWRVIGVVAGVAFVGAASCASLAALRAARSGAADVLRRGTAPTRSEVALRRVFVVGEVALAFLLLLSMSLLGRALLTSLRADPGFNPRGVLALQVSLPRESYSTRERVVSFYLALEHALEQRLGSRSVSLVDELPLTGDGGRALVAVGATETRHEAVLRTVSPGYFDVMRIPVLDGRPFVSQDDTNAPLRVVISRSLADRDFRFEQPVGRQLLLGRGALPVEIVGVVGDVKHRALDEASLPTVYVPAWQVPSPSSIVVARSGLPEADVIAAVREEVGRLDGDLPVYRVRSMRDVVAASPGVPARRMLTTVFSAFALLGVVLSTIGLFGVVAHDVACRRTELAVRIALGADPLRILGATLGQGALMVGSGLAAGAVLSYWAVGALGVAVATGRPDAVSIVSAAAVLMLTGAGAVLPAALRAARTDPLAVLRSE
jgi:predicted permease